MRPLEEMAVLVQLEKIRSRKTYVDATVNYNQAKDKDDAFARAKARITPEYVAKFQVKADIDYDESAGKMTAKGKGFTLTLNFDDSSVGVNLDVSLLLRPLKGKIVDKIKRELERNV